MVQNGKNDLFWDRTFAEMYYLQFLWMDLPLASIYYTKSQQ